MKFIKHFQIEISPLFRMDTIWAGHLDILRNLHYDIWSYIYAGHIRIICCKFYHKTILNYCNLVLLSYFHIHMAVDFFSYTVDIHSDDDIVDHKCECYKPTFAYTKN